MRNRKQGVVRRIVSIALAILILGSLVSGALIVLVNAESSAEIKDRLVELREQQSELEAESNALEASINENQSKTQTIVEQKSDIDQQMEMTRQKIENLKEQVQQYSLLIAAKQKEVDQAEQNEQTLQAQYRTRIRSMEETGSVSYWSILFQASSFSDLLDRMDMIQEIAKADQLMLEQLAEATAAVKTEREELGAQRAELEEAQTALADEQAVLEAQRGQADLLIIQMQLEYAALSEEFKAAEEAEDELRQTIKETETAYFNALQKEKAEAERIAALNRQNNNKADANSAGATASGGFLFPLAYSNGVTDAYGPRTHPIYGYQGFHYGVDLGSSMNCAIYATKSGTVTASSYGEANGYYVTINHGDGYSSVYAHMVSNEVSAGDYVTQGQVIGHVGTSGWSTGPHLHFEILLNGSNINPMTCISLP